MFGFLKRTITPRDLGIILTSYSHSFITADAGRSIGLLLGVAGDYESLEAAQRVGFDDSLRQHYVQLYFLCSIDAACSDFNNNVRNDIVDGVIDCFKVDSTNKDDLYNLIKSVRLLDNDILFADQYVDTEKFRLPFLNKSLIAPCYSLAIIDHFHNGLLVEFAADRDRLDGFCSQFSASVATVYRASTQASKTYRLR